MPELPDVELYVDRLRPRVVGRALCAVRLWSPFLLRSVDPPVDAVVGRRASDVRRLGKRIVLSFEGELHLVLHLMIAGRLQWRAAGADRPGRSGLAAFDFEEGVLTLTEAGSKKRASLWVERGAGWREHDRGGLEVQGATASEFAAALGRRNHTLKRALCDPSILSGIGNAYSDEILHRARLSPVQRTANLDAAALERLRRACVEVLTEWTRRLAEELGPDGFPTVVTAFRPGMAVHGRFGQPCPECGGAVQRIRYASNETNYCPACQTGGRLLADRALSQLLKQDWPRTLEELEERRARDSTP